VVEVNACSKSSRPVQTNDLHLDVARLPVELKDPEIRLVDGGWVVAKLVAGWGAAEVHLI
jgi:hypothetical protein